MEDAVLEALAKDIDDQYSVTANSVQSLKKELEALDTQISRLNSLESTLGSDTNAGRYVNQHLNKAPGEGGTFGLKSKKADLYKSYMMQEKNLVTLSSLSQLYHAVLNESTIPELPEVPERDMDAAESKPDFVYQNRSEFPEMELSDSGEPIEWAIGSTIVVDGIHYTYIGKAETLNVYMDESGWEPTACQERACLIPPEGGA